MSILLSGITPNNAVDERNSASKVRDAYQLPKSERQTEERIEPSFEDYLLDAELRELVGRDYCK